MSGVSSTQNLFCEACNKIMPHHTNWSSEHPSDIDAQCFHFGPRAVSGFVQARKIGKMIYWFLQDYKRR